MSAPPPTEEVAVVEFGVVLLALVMGVASNEDCSADGKTRQSSLGQAIRCSHRDADRRQSIFARFEMNGELNPIQS